MHSTDSPAAELSRAAIHSYLSKQVNAYRISPKLYSEEDFKADGQLGRVPDEFWTVTDCQMVRQLSDISKETAGHQRAELANNYGIDEFRDLFAGDLSQLPYRIMLLQHRAVERISVALIYEGTRLVKFRLYGVSKSLELRLETFRNA